MYYDFIKSDLYSFPVYFTYSSDNYIFENIDDRILRNYLELELATRKHLFLTLKSKVYLEGGIQSRFLLRNNNYIKINNEELDFRRFNLVPKVGIGVRIFHNVYFNLEYWNSLLGLFENENKFLNKYIGMRLTLGVVNENYR